MDGELDFVGGEAQGLPGRVSHREEAVELRHERVEVQCEGGSGGGRVGDQEGDGTPLIDLRGDPEREGTVGITENTRGNVWESGSYQGGLVVFRGGRVRSVEPSFCRGERLGGRNIPH